MEVLEGLGGLITVGDTTAPLVPGALVVPIYHSIYNLSRNYGTSVVYISSVIIDVVLPLLLFIVEECDNLGAFTVVLVKTLLTKNESISCCSLFIFSRCSYFISSPLVCMGVSLGVPFSTHFG